GVRPRGSCGVSKSWSIKTSMEASEAASGGRVGVLSRRGRETLHQAVALRVHRLQQPRPDRVQVADVVGVELAAEVARERVEKDRKGPLDRVAALVGEHRVDRTPILRRDLAPDVAGLL